MHGPTCIFWANLTPFSLKTGGRIAEALEGQAFAEPHEWRE